MTERLDRRTVIVGMGGVVVAPYPAWSRARAQQIAAQPFFANVLRVAEALSRLGQPLPPETVSRLRALATRTDSTAINEAEGLLDAFVLLEVVLGAGGYGVSRPGGAERTLVEQGWRTFLLRVINPAGSTDRLYLDVDTPVLGQVQADSSGRFAHERQGLQGEAVMLDTVRRARIAVLPQDDPPLVRPLSGLPLEYRLANVIGFSPGRHETALMVGAFAAPQFVWAPAAKTRLTFDVRPSSDVAFRIREPDGRGTTAALTVRDRQGRVYPHRFGRLAPDMGFHDQVYRADGESLRLPDGEYQITAVRGPEYVARTLDLTVRGAEPTPIIELERWIDPAARGWYSGDVHIHAAGCAHYNDPTIGVAPETMIRHVRGEGLWVGEVLTWGPGFQTQKRNFTGRAVSPPSALEAPPLQDANGTTLRPQPTVTDDQSLLRYDIEVSGFPSSHTGHLILMQLSEQEYPGTTGPVDWPSWSLPIQRWARDQGGVTGFAHCGLGLADLDDIIPSRVVPSFDSIGANEFLVDLAHDAVDFLAGGSTIPQAELTLWYHVLNCGFRTVFVGETDWPCMSDERVGAARTYVGLASPPQGDDGYGAWVAGLKAGRVYMGDGRAHALRFDVGGVGPGETLKVASGGPLTVSATVAARLDPEPPADLADVVSRPAWLEPRWTLERARRPGTRSVEVEVIVNGEVAARHTLVADGREVDLSETLALERSGWIALRILPAMHVQPVFIEVGGAPIRASRASADWCLESLAVLERTQLPRIEPGEREAAATAYAEARRRFEEIRRQCP